MSLNRGFPFAEDMREKANNYKKNLNKCSEDLINIYIDQIYNEIEEAANKGEYKVVIKLRKFETVVNEISSKNNYSSDEVSLNTIRMLESDLRVAGYNKNNSDTFISYDYSKIPVYESGDHPLVINLDWEKVNKR